MKAKHYSSRYRWLVGSLSVWLLCAWVARQPAPVEVTSKEPVSESINQSVRIPAIVQAERSVDSLNVDPESGLALDQNLMLVKGQCTACHSSKLILQSHFDREKWVERIRWMQRTQKLWDLGESEPAILTYLTKYYGPAKIPFDGRRLPLPIPAWHSR